MEIGDKEVKGGGNDWGTKFIKLECAENTRKGLCTPCPLCLCGEKIPIN